jgi:pimeloyl-ACP methyl ester carboxylesterase/nucleoside-diphosphate-sugar epimerase
MEQHARPDSLVTGATGFIGRWLVATLTRRGARVAALVRDGAPRGPELARFIDELGGDSARLTVIDGDLEADDLGITDPGQLGAIRDVYHLAARMELGMKPEVARSVNAAGTDRVLRWAATRPRLGKVVYLGGYRVEAMPGWLEDAPVPLPDRIRRRLYGRYGAYEASKLEAHVIARALGAELGLPMAIVNPSGVIGDSRTGMTTQVEGLGETVGRLWRGKLPALAGSRETFVPVIAVDVLADLIASAEPEHGELTALDPATPNLPELVGQIAAHAGIRAPERILPLAVIRALPSALTGLGPEALGFLSEDRYDASAAEALAAGAGLTMPPIAETLGRWVDELVSTRFLDAPGAPRGRFRDAGGARIFAVGDPERAERVMLHGLPWTANSWEPLLDALGGRERSVRPDLPGLGRSAPLPDPGADWLADLVGGGDRRIELVGHSAGTATAVEYAAAHPESVERLVLIAPAFLQRRAPWLMRRSSLVAAGLRRSSPEALRDRLVGGADVDPEALASAHAELRRKGVARRAARLLAASSRSETRRRLAATLTRVVDAGVPVTLVVGAADPLVESAPGGVRVVEIAGAGHCPHLTHAVEVAVAIGNWQSAIG